MPGNPSSHFVSQGLATRSHSLNGLGYGLLMLTRLLALSAPGVFVQWGYVPHFQKRFGIENALPEPVVGVKEINRQTSHSIVCLYWLPPATLAIYRRRLPGNDPSTASKAIKMLDTLPNATSRNKSLIPFWGRYELRSPDTHGAWAKATAL